MATSSGGSKSTRSSGTRKSTSAKGKGSAGKRASTSSKRAGSTGKRTGTARKRSTASAKRASTTSKRSAGARKAATSKRTGGARSTAAGRSDKSVQAFREALERSRSALEDNVTVSRERLQEVVDDSVKRGRMTRADANELVSNLVSRGRQATDDLMRDLEKLLDQARKEVETRTASTRRQATRAAERVGRAARDAADRPLAEADKLRRRAGGPGAPITGYEQLTATQIKGRLGDLTKADLRKVRTAEKRGKARKSILDAIEKQLDR
jgi:polyhydroxyalkanoate synthesis regulator phasin